MVFKSIRNSRSGSVATWTFSGHAHYAAQDDLVYILRTRPLCVLPQGTPIPELPTSGLGSAKPIACDAADGATLTRRSGRGAP
jgi:hypothetical protein